MSDGMSDGKYYGPFLSKHGPPIVSENGKPVQEPRYCVKCGKRMLPGDEAHPYVCDGPGNCANPAPFQEG